VRVDSLNGPDGRSENHAGDRGMANRPFPSANARERSAPPDLPPSVEPNVNERLNLQDGIRIISLFGCNDADRPVVAQSKPPSHLLSPPLAADTAISL
jgi:hypothetical protein